MAHSRNNSAMSTSSALRSPSPSPSSPNSPVADGLSRRLSWNRPREDTLGVQSAYSTSSSLSPRDRDHGVPEEHDIGLPAVADTAGRPFFHNFSSEASLESSADRDSSFDLEEQDDLEGLTSGQGDGVGLSPLHPGHRRQPSRRVYDEHGVIRPTGPLKLAGVIQRSPTLRHVSNTLRKASIRVVNIMGSEREDGMVRLDDQDADHEDAHKYTSGEGGAGQVNPDRPDPMPPEGHLRGRTLSLFTGNSVIRRAMGKLLAFPYTEPAILILIITNVVVLTIQAAPPLNSPRIDPGYFNAWEDFVLLGLFALFTVEMFARIVVTGLILDPDQTLRNYLFSPTGIVTIAEKRFRRAQDNVQRSTTKREIRKHDWQTRDPPVRKATASSSILSEAPFQRAVAKQQSLSAQGRPYLRHSWHRIDMLAVIAFWITFLLALFGQEATADRHLYIFRSLSILRAGRLLVITSGTTTILHSLKRAGPLLITVAYFVIFAAGIFSIIGVQSFRGSFRRDCILTDPNNGTNIISLSQQCGGYLDPTTLSAMPYLDINGGPANVPAKGYICPLGQVCQTTDQNPDGDALSFDNIFSSLIQVITIASINTWSPIMYTAMESDFFSSSLYFIVAVIVLNFWLMNLVVAVVVNTFKDIRAETKRSAFGAERLSGEGSDPQWAIEKPRRRTNRILTIYEKTELLWVGIVLADLVAQACKTADSSDSTIDLLKNLELAFTFAFDLEMIIRIAGYFPDWRAFFERGRNSFDLFLAVSCSVIQIPAVSSASAYPWLTVFQLMRWYRFILAFPRMKPLLITVFGSFAGLLNMVVFLFMMNFIGALMAVQLFRGDIELSLGYTIDFSQAYNSFLGMYQIFSSENWSTVLYAAMEAETPFAQFWIAAIFLCGWLLFSNFVVLQMFIAVINENFAVAEEQKRQRQVEAFVRKSEPISAHASWIDRFNPYRLMSAHHNTVTVDSLPPNLVLPLKQSIGTDVGDIPTKAMDGENTSGGTGAMRRLFGFKSINDEIPLHTLSRPLPSRFDGFDDDPDDDRGLTELLPPLQAGPSVDEHLDALRERRNQQADFIAAHPSFDTSLWLFRQSNPIRRFCQSCVSPAHGERIFGRPANPIISLIFKTLLFVSVAASIAVAAVATPLYRKTYYAEHGVYRGTWFDLTEVALGMIFVLEAAIKIIADGFVFTPNAYILSIWNVLDFVILVTLLVNTTTSLIFIGGLSRVTRALKGFRALRLITLFSRLRDTFHAVLFAGALRILDASVLMALYIIPFAVWGLNIFSGLLYFCNDSDSTGIASCIGEYMPSPVDDSLGFIAPRVWQNPAGLQQSIWAFDSFRQSVLILFEIVSLEGWTNVMTSVMNIVGQDQQASLNAAQWNAIYLLLFHLFGGVIILTLFVSIIIENFSTRSGNALLTVEQRQWVDLLKFIKQQTPSQLPKQRPVDGLRGWCYNRATSKHGYWTQTFTVIYYVHILLLMTEDFSNNILNDEQLRDWIFLGLTILYAIDLLVRFYGLGFQSFSANGWNIFDLVVITGSFATTIPALRADIQGVAGSQVNIQLQKLFLVSISLKLVQRISSLNQLFKTSVASLPAIGNLFLLWATLFIFFAILFMEVFGLTKQGDNAYTRFQNYYSFGNTLVMLAFMSTGEGWNGYMHDYTMATPRCIDDSNFLKSDCGSPSWAFGLFISWNILSMYIFVNMFTGVVVESFAYVYQMPGGSSIDREEIRGFKKVWSEFDTERTGYLKRKDFIPFFSKLYGVFEVRMYPAEFSVQNLVRNAIPDPVENASGKLLVAVGVKRAVDVRRLEAQISQIDYKRVRARRLLLSRLYSEARITGDREKGISFTAMLILLAHHKLIDDEKALQLGDLLVRQEKMARVADIVNKDRVRGLLLTMFARRRYLAARAESKRTLNAEAEGIPAIVLEPMQVTPPPAEEEDPFSNHDHHRCPSAPPNRDVTPVSSPGGRMRDSSTPEMAMTLKASRHSPSLSVGSPGRPSVARSLSSSSLLSSEDAHLRRNSLNEDRPPDDMLESMATSVWGDMMREAVDKDL